jgi:hypothetical protein
MSRIARIVDYGIIGRAVVVRNSGQLVPGQLVAVLPLVKETIAVAPEGPVASESTQTCASKSADGAFPEAGSFSCERTPLCRALTHPASPMIATILQMTPGSRVKPSTDAGQLIAYQHVDDPPTAEHGAHGYPPCFA